MGIRQWLGFSRPRDAPAKKLPDIQDNVRDSGGMFVFGRADSGERVDEKSAMQIATVYACVRLLAESVASLPLHLFHVTDDDGGKKRPGTILCILFCFGSRIRRCPASHFVRP